MTQLDEPQEVADLDGIRSVTLSAAEPTPIDALLLLVVSGTRSSVAALMGTRVTPARAPLASAHAGTSLSE